MSRSSSPRIPSAGSHSTDGAAYRQMTCCHCTCGVPAHRVWATLTCGTVNGNSGLTSRLKASRARSRRPAGLLAMPEQSRAMPITTAGPVACPAGAVEDLHGPVAAVSDLGRADQRPAAGPASGPEGPPAGSPPAESDRLAGRRVTAPGRRHRALGPVQAGLAVLLRRRTPAFQPPARPAAAAAASMIRTPAAAPSGTATRRPPSRPR